MSDKRLDRLFPALSAKERAVLVLRAFKAGAKADQVIYNTAPSVQTTEFNRLVRTMNAVNVELSMALLLIREQLAKADLRYAWLMTLLIWGLEVRVLGDDLLAATKDCTLRQQIRKFMKRAPRDMIAPIDLTNAPEYSRDRWGDALVHGLLSGLAESLEQHWRELRSIEIGVQEVADEFDGEDPLQPDVRAMLTECLGSCTRIRDAVSDYVGIELSEATDEDVGVVRQLIAKVVDS